MFPRESIQRIGSQALICLAVPLFILCLSRGVSAEIAPSAFTLVPYFEVDLARPNLGPTSLFSVVNSSPWATSVQVTVYTNWGIPVLELTLALRAGEVRSVNLRDWLAYGNLPDRKLSVDELAHLQAALSGKPSPKDGLYYASGVGPGLAVGSIAIDASGTDQPGMLWGDVVIIGPELSSLQAGVLVNFNGPTESRRPSCTRHAVRFHNSGVPEHRTQVVLWTGRRLAPSPDPEPVGGLVPALMRVRDEAGTHLESRSFDVLPLQALEVVDLNLKPASGWLDIHTESPVYVAAHLHSTSGGSAELQTYCMPEEDFSEGASGIVVRLFANGEETSSPPGPSFYSGTTIAWEYRVSNVGFAPLARIVVNDGLDVAVTCPKDALDPGESMTCAAKSLAVICENTRETTVTAVRPDGSQVSNHLVAYYYGHPQAALRIIASVHGDDANEPPGPTFMYLNYLSFSVALVWSNEGDVALDDVVVSDPTPGCTGSRRLNPGESAWCSTQRGYLPERVNRYEVFVTGKPPCGPTVTAHDHAYYSYRNCPWLHPWCI